MKKIVSLLLFLIIAGGGIYTAWVYFVPFGEGVRSGELTKFSREGFIFMTWEGEITETTAGAPTFKFSVEKDQQEVIEKLIDYQGRYVKVGYKQRYGTFFWLGNSTHYITKVYEAEDPESVPPGSN